MKLLRKLRPATWLRALGRFIPVRHRYILTRNNNLRLRYSLPSLALCVAVSVFALGDHTGSFVVPDLTTYQFASIADMNGPETELSAMQKRLQRYVSDSGETREGIQLASLTPQAPQPKEKTLKIDKGDTLAGVLQEAGVPAGEALSAVKAMQKHYDPRLIKPGQEIYVRFDPAEEGENDFDFAEMRMDIDALKSISLKRMGDSGFESAMQEKDTRTKIYAKSADIEVSLYGSSEKAGIPSAVVAQAIHIYSWDIDFQRDIRRGDVLDVMYEQTETEDGVKVKTGDLIYARLNLSGEDVPIYRYETPDGNVDYYTANGASVRKALLKTPVDGARISSGFGVREHPVLGYTKMHKGIDFAAPRGTPIYAAGDGIVEKAGRFSSFGNYVRIRHNSTTKTAYGHLNGFAKGLIAGDRVKQGEVIGYVGTTGRSTGPHLHYEVLLNGTQVNPNSVKLPQGEVLHGKQLAAFKDHVQKVQRQYIALVGGTKVASRQVASDSTLR